MAETTALTKEAVAEADGVVENARQGFEKRTQAAEGAVQGDPIRTGCSLDSAGW